LVEICSQWMESKEEISCVLGPSLLLGLVRWTILHPLTEHKGKSASEDTTFAQLHLSILEALAETQKIMNPQKKFPAVTNKSVVLLISRVEERLKSYDSQCDLGSNKELSLDRLGQFVHCLTATGGIQGKLNEVMSSVKRIMNDNRLLQMYISRNS